MNGIIGTCSICGGDVYGHVGPWFGVIPPPPARCSKCGASESKGPVINMTPSNHRGNYTVTTGTSINIKGGEDE